VTLSPYSRRLLHVDANFLPFIHRQLATAVR
jgi:hypothetical protein